MEIMEDEMAALDVIKPAIVVPPQGLEIVNPQAAEKKVNEANAKYFSNTSGFLSVGVGKKTT